MRKAEKFHFSVAFALKDMEIKWIASHECWGQGHFRAVFPCTGVMVIYINTASNAFSADSSWCPSSHLCMRIFTLSNMNISKTSGLIAIKFHLKHHWVGERQHLVLVQIGSELVSMVTDSSHRLIMEKTMLPLFLGWSNLFYTCR